MLTQKGKWGRTKTHKLVFFSTFKKVKLRQLDPTLLFRTYDATL